MPAGAGQLASKKIKIIRPPPTGRQHQLTPFELLTAVAMDHFAAASVDLAVLEVGLGGRLDATTCHPNRPVLGIANIGLDHREHLGSTLEAIATEKAGIFHTGAVAFSAPQQDAVARVLEQQAEQAPTVLDALGNILINPA